MNVFIGYSKGTWLSAYSFLKIKGMNKLYVAVPSKVVFIELFFLFFYYLCHIPAKASWFHIWKLQSNLGLPIRNTQGCFRSPHFLSCIYDALNIYCVLNAYKLPI